MAKEMIIWDAVKETGNALSAINNFSNSVGNLISSYKVTKQLDKVKTQQIIIEAQKTIQKMQNLADYEIATYDMELIQSAMQKANNAPDDFSRSVSMEYVAILHEKFKRKLM